MKGNYNKSIMKRINPLRYYLNNKKKMILLLAIISIAVFCISSIRTLVSSVYDTSKKANVDVFNYFSIVQESSENAREWLSNNEGSLQCYDVNVTTTSITTVLGTTSSYIIAVNDMTGLLECLDVNIIEGKRPAEGNDEILLNSSVAKNKKLKVGDTVGDFSVCGIFDGEMQVGFCYLSDFADAYGNFATSMLVIPQEGVDINKVNELCNAFRDDNSSSNNVGKKIELVTRETQLKSLDDEFETMNLIMNIIVIMVSISLAIAVAAFVHTSYTNRNEEFAIYYALGYGIRDIIRLILEETIYISAFAYILGNSISATIMKIVELNVYKPIGQAMEVISGQNLGFTLIIPMLVVLFSGIPVTQRLRKMDLLMLIERR